MLKIRRSQDPLIFNMGMPKLVRRHLYAETAPAGYKYWEEQRQKQGKITEIANLDMEDNLETICKNKWELGTAYWISFSVSYKLFVLFINCTSGFSLIYFRSPEILCPTQVKYVFTLSTTRVTGTVDDCYWWLQLLLWPIDTLARGSSYDISVT